MATGVVAVGDSITNGGTMHIGPLKTRSYAHWVAEALSTEATVFAISGAVSQQIAGELLPQITGSFALAIGYAGTNDIIATSWKPQLLAENLTRIADTLATHAERVVLLTFPVRLGAVPTVWPYGPRRRQRIDEANEVVRSVAEATGCLAVDLTWLRGRYNVWSDRLHPTARGQVLIADAIVRAVDPDAPPPLSLCADRWRRPDLAWQWWYTRTSARNIFLRPIARAFRAAQASVHLEDALDGLRPQR